MRRPSSGCADSERMTPSVVGSVASMPGLSPSARSARAGFGPRVIVRSFAQTLDETRPQRGLVFVDAAQDAREPFAGDEHEIVEAAVGQLHGEREHLRAVRRVVDRDQRTTQHFGAAPLEKPLNTSSSRISGTAMRLPLRFQSIWAGGVIGGITARRDCNPADDAAGR